MRGKHDLSCILTRNISGSPPHARETPERHIPQRGELRITPACAGNTGRSGRAVIRWRDHPRMRGKHPFFPPTTRLIWGSPPHARETRIPPRRRVTCMRIPPACAGNTKTAPAAETGKGDHPRMRGKHDCNSRRVLSVTGSPPHARETRRCMGCHVRAAGITPACAGNTHPVSPELSCWRDHPRMRGKHNEIASSTFGRKGSPPHARETPAESGVLYGWPRITPACAGNTSSGASVFCAVWDHPRMRGKH